MKTMSMRMELRLDSSERHFWNVCTSRVELHKCLHTDVYTVMVRIWGPVLSHGVILGCIDCANVRANGWYMCRGM